MARPSRSSGSGTPAPSAADLKSKKRKREASVAGEQDSERPAAKHPRSEPNVQLPADPYLEASDAHKILAILEVADTNGLLDRVFNGQSVSGPSSIPSTSLRKLLLDSSNSTLARVRAAVANLLPISSHPRALLSPAAAQQQRFCELVLDLLSQATARTSAINNIDLKLQNNDDDLPELRPEDRKRQYALVQRLPTGDWWSSSVIPRAGISGLTRAEATALSTKQAELVAIIPSLPIPPEDVGTLGSLRPLVSKHRELKEDSSMDVYLPRRKVPTPKLLDYGLYSSFCPSYDSHGAELGPEQTYEIKSDSLLKKRARAARNALLEKQKRAAIAAETEHQPAVDESSEDVNMESDPMDEDTLEQENPSPAETSKEKVQPTSHFSAHEAIRQLHGLLPPEETATLKEALRVLDLEVGVSELISQISIALDRLVGLQNERLLSRVELSADSEEHKLAETISSSLALILSLQPRTAARPDKSVVPPAQILRTLHRSTPLQTKSGWRGTLASTRAHALRDDTTVHVKPTARAQAAAAASSSQPPTYTNGAHPTTASRAAVPPTIPSPYAANPSMYGFFPGYHNYGHGHPSGAMGAPAGTPRVIGDVTKQPHFSRWPAYAQPGPGVPQVQTPTRPLVGPNKSFYRDR